MATSRHSLRSALLSQPDWKGIGEEYNTASFAQIHHPSDSANFSQAENSLGRH